MLNTLDFTPKQQELIRKMRTHFGKKTSVTRPEMMVFMSQTYEQKYAPAFICKNDALKVVEDGKTIRGRYTIPTVPAVKVTGKRAVAVQTAPVVETPNPGVSTPTIVAKKSRAKAAGVTTDAVASPVEVVELTNNGEPKHE